MFILGFILVFFVFPFALTWSVNTLFLTSIPYTVETWISWIIIEIIVMALTAPHASNGKKHG